MQCGIYKILNKNNGKFYIGSSKNIEKRWKRHKIRLSNNYHPNQHLQASWNKYGEGSFDLLVIEECCIDMLLEREQYYIDNTNCIDKKVGYNMSTKAGKGPDCTGLRQYHHMKMVNQYDLAGNFIKSFKCANDVERELGISNKSISACCNGRLKSAGGFMWTHDNNPYKTIKPYKKRKIEYTDELRKKFSEIQKSKGPNKDIINRRKKIEQYDMDGNLIRCFDYAGVAAKFYGYNEATIRIAANSNTNIAYNYIWKYTK